MANKGLKGITYEINGSTVGLQNALKEVNTKTRDLNSELKQVQRLLKLDPNNVTLLKQKQDLLNKSISETKDKLNTLKDAQSQVEQQFRNGDIGEEQYRSFQREIENTKQKLKQLEDQAKNTGSILGTHLQNAGEKISSAGQKISGAGQSLMPVTGAIVGIGTAAVVAGDNFEAQMSRVKAISGATGQDFEALRNQALQLGQDTAFSAGEVAEGMENLASAGFSTQEIMSAMPGMLDLAASSGEDLASSSDICASTLRGFGLAAGDAGHVADVLAKSSADTNASVASLGEAMKYIAPVANSAGWSLEQVTAAIGEMADQGIKGEQAGTTLRGALTNLMNPSSEAAKAMQSIGFSAYNSQGKMKPLSDIIADLNSKTKGLSNQQRDQVVSTIMGTNALSGMQVLLKDGSSNLDKLTASLKNSDGASKAMASTMQDNTKGSIEQMMGSIETAAIKIQTALAPTITNIANSITGLVNKFSSLDSAQQETIIKIAGIVAAVAPALLIVGKMTTGIGALTSGVGKTMTAVSNFQKVLKGGGTLAKAFSAALTPAGAVVAAVIAVTAVVALLVVGIKHLYDTNANFRNAVNTIWNSIKSTLQTIANWFSGSFLPMLQKAPEQIKTFFTGLPSFFNSLLNQIKINVSNTINEIKTTVSNIANTIFNTVKTKLNQLNITLQKHATQIKVVAGILGTVFGPALIKSGIQAVTAGSKIASGFIVNLVKTGAQAAITGAKLTANFVASMIKSGAEAVINGAKITASFVTSMIQSGAQAVVNGAKLTASFTASMIEAGAQAVINGAKVVSSFIASMIQAAAQAITTGAAITGNLIAAIVAYAASGWKAVAAITAQTTAWVAQKAVTIASTVATKAATAAQWLFNAALNANPIGIVITAITALVGALVILYNKNKTFRDFINNMWSNIKTGWMNVINGIESAWDSLNPLQWGKDFMDGLINGIKSKIEDIKNAVKNVANTIHSHLHFSRPDEGPLADYETWMPDFMSGLAEGITNNIFKVKNAVSQVASSMVNAVPTDLSLNIGASINGINGLRTAYASAQSVSTSTYNTPINIKMGDITVQGNADQNALVQMKQIAQDQVDQLEQHLIYAFTLLPSKACVKVK